MLIFDTNVLACPNEAAELASNRIDGRLRVIEGVGSQIASGVECHSVISTTGPTVRLGQVICHRGFFRNKFGIWPLEKDISLRNDTQTSTVRYSAEQLLI